MFSKRFFCKFILLIFIFSTPLFSKYIYKAKIIAHVLNLREKPSIKSKILYKLKKGTSVVILKRKGKWALINFDNKTGWVYIGGLGKISKNFISNYNVKIEFNNFSETFIEKVLEFKNFLNFDFYKNNVKIVFSYDNKNNKLTSFIIIPFNKNYYEKNREHSLKKNEIDLYPFLNFAYVFDNFIKKVEKRYPVCGEFLKKFDISIIIKKNSNFFIILNLKRKNKLFKFLPYIIVKKKGYDYVKIYAENKQKVEKSYIFELSPPYVSYGIKSTSYLLYKFFDLYWFFYSILISS